MSQMVRQLRQAAAGERRRATAQLEREAADRLVICARLLAGDEFEHVAEFLARTWGFEPPRPDSMGGARAYLWEREVGRAREQVKALLDLIGTPGVFDNPQSMVYKDCPFGRRVYPGQSVRLAEAVR